MREKLKEFNELTILGIKYIEEDRDIEELIEKREGIINWLKENNSSKEEFKEICKEINLLKNDEALKVKIREKQNQVKLEIDTIKKRRQVQRSYTNNAKPIYFNKTI